MEHKPFARSDAHRVVIFGARGFLGGYFCRAYPEAATPPVDIADPAAVERTLDQAVPEVVINCAGKTGTPNIDWCEDHRLETVHSNVTGPLVFAQECLRRGLYLVHLSSGCIYQGDNGGQGFSEEDPPNFHGSFYARSKIWTEQVLREFPILILRLRLPFDGSTSPRNLLMKLRGYRRVLTATNSMTCLPDFVQTAVRLIERRATGTYNVVNEGVVSPFEIMQLHRQIVDSTQSFEPLDVQGLSGIVRAERSNCWLNTAKLRGEGLALPPVREAVERSLRAFRESWSARGVSRPANE